MVKVKLFEGLKNYLPAGVTYSQFDTNYKLGSKKVLPTISDDLKDGAKRATIFALLIIHFISLFASATGDILWELLFHLLHDVLVTLAVFSFARGIVPFPLKLTSILSRLY
jgi:SecD/SecF fusion protein